MTDKKKETRGRKSNKDKGLTSKAVQPVSAWLSQETFDRLNAHTDKLKRSRAALIAGLIEDYLNSPVAKIREKAEEKIENL